MLSWALLAGCCERVGWRVCEPRGCPAVVTLGGELGSSDYAGLGPWYRSLALSRQLTVDATPCNSRSIPNCIYSWNALYVHLHVPFQMFVALMVNHCVLWYAAMRPLCHLASCGSTCAAFST